MCCANFLLYELIETKSRVRGCRMPKAIDDSGMENSVTATLRLMLPSQKTAEG